MNSIGELVRFGRGLPDPNYTLLAPMSREIHKRACENWVLNAKVYADNCLPIPAPPKPLPPSGTLCPNCRMEICPEGDEPPNHKYHCWGISQR